MKKTNDWRAAVRPRTIVNFLWKHSSVRFSDKKKKKKCRIITNSTNGRLRRSTIVWSSSTNESMTFNKNNLDFKQNKFNFNRLSSDARPRSCSQDPNKPTERVEPITFLPTSTRTRRAVATQSLARQSMLRVTVAEHSIGTTSRYQTIRVLKQARPLLLSRSWTWTGLSESMLIMLIMARMVKMVIMVRVIIQLILILCSRPWLPIKWCQDFWTTGNLSRPWTFQEAKKFIIKVGRLIIFIRRLPAPAKRMPTRSNLLRFTKYQIRRAKIIISPYSAPWTQTTIFSPMKFHRLVKLLPARITSRLLVAERRTFPSLLRRVLGTSMFNPLRDQQIPAAIAAVGACPRLFLHPTQRRRNNNHHHRRLSPKGKHRFSKWDLFFVTFVNFIFSSVFCPSNLFIIFSPPVSGQRSLLEIRSLLKYWLRLINGARQGKKKKKIIKENKKHGWKCSSESQHFSVWTF